MPTKLDRVLKRELAIDGEPYTLTLSEEGFTLTLKGRRKGLDIRWKDLVGGDAALATALNASLTANLTPRGKRDSAPKERTMTAARTRVDATAKSAEKSAGRKPPARRPVARARRRGSSR